LLGGEPEAVFIPAAIAAVAGAYAGSKLFIQAAREWVDGRR
jgi:hypothetical protein